jgi:hypothetical protein
MRSRGRGGATGTQARRAGADLELQARIAVEIGNLLPGARRGVPKRSPRMRHSPASGRVTRTAAGRALDPETLELAVLASVRHQDTGYDELLMTGLDRPWRVSGVVRA